MTKFDPLLRDMVGGDPAGDIYSVIIEYNIMPSQLDIQAAHGYGLNVTGFSDTAPYIYANGTREALLALEEDVNVKNIYLSEGVGAMYG